MNQIRAAASDIDLCAFLDGELPMERRAEIEAWLVRQPEARAKIDAWRQQGSLMRASFGRIAQEPLPRQLLAALSPAPEPIRLANASVAAVAPLRSGEPALRAPAQEPRRLWRTVAMLVLGCSAVIGVLASGALQHIGPEPQVVATTVMPGYGLTRHALEAHAAFAGRADRLLDVRGADPAALGAAAIQNGLDVRLPAAVAGLRPLGLRLTPGEGGVAGLMVFASDRNGPVSLYVTRGVRGGAPGLALRESGGVTVATFHVEGAAYALTGAAPRDQMVDWASALRTTLTQPRSLRGS